MCRVYERDGQDCTLRKKYAGRDAPSSLAHRQQGKDGENVLQYKEFYYETTIAPRDLDRVGRDSGDGGHWVTDDQHMAGMPYGS